MKKIDYSPALKDRLARFYDLVNQNLTDKQAEEKIRELIREAEPISRRKQ